MHLVKLSNKYSVFIIKTLNAQLILIKLIKLDIFFKILKLGVWAISPNIIYITLIIYMRFRAKNKVK